MKLYCWLVVGLWIAFAVLAPSGGCLGGELVLDTYDDGLSENWEEKSFRGKTSYEITKDQGIKCIKAVSTATASALYFKIKYDPAKYPYLTWKWKVANTISKGDATRKEGDDYAARVYVVFPRFLFWKTKAINYVWANKLSKGRAVPNPFTGNVMMVAVESGRDKVGQWVQETRNVLEDYRRFFKKEPPKVGAISIMSDTDNTRESATAWYGIIKIHDAKGMRSLKGK